MKKQTTDGLHNAFHAQEEHYEDQKKKRARSKKEEKNVTRFIRTKTAFFTTFTYISIVCWVFVGYVMYNYVTLEDAENDPVTPVKAQVIQVEVIESESVTGAKNEGIPEGYEVAFTQYMEVSAYTAQESETDSSPTITANGDTVYVGGVACPRNFKFDTKVMIDGSVYTCNDRMNKRYTNNIDIYMEKLQDAKSWGRQSKEVIVLKSV